MTRHARLAKLAGMSALTLPAFLCLFAALLLALHPRSRTPSLLMAVCSIALAALSGTVQWPALCAMAPALVLLKLAHTSSRWQFIALAALAMWALAAALHLIPGFTPLLWQNDFGRDAQLPLRWHFDKGLGGLILLHALRPQWIIGDLKRWALLLPLCAGLLALTTLFGLATYDPRWLPSLLLWLTGNLFLTVIAEEAFFRGLIQSRLQQHLPGRFASPLAVSGTALVFALVHLPWGLSFALFAGLAGLFYGWMAGRESSLQRAIAAHFSLNALSLILMRSPFG